MFVLIIQLVTGHVQEAVLELSLQVSFYIIFRK